MFPYNLGYECCRYWCVLKWLLHIICMVVDTCSYVNDIISASNIFSCIFNNPYSLRSNMNFYQSGWHWHWRFYNVPFEWLTCHCWISIIDFHGHESFNCIYVTWISQAFQIEHLEVLQDLAHYVIMRELHE